MEILIENYEALENVLLNIKPGITQITGKTNSGKSSLMRALQDFYKNSAGKDEITKDQGEMLIQVNGNYFKRNNTRKEYFIDGVSYGKPGKGPFPELDKLGLGDVNFQNQQSSLFLIGDTPGAKYDYIISGRDDKYLTVMSDMKKEYKESSVKHKLLVGQLGAEEQKLEAVNNDLAAFDYEKLNELICLIESKKSEIDRLEEMLKRQNKIESIEKSIVGIEDRIISEDFFEEINMLDIKKNIKEKIEKIENVSSKIESIKTIDETLFEKTNYLIKCAEIKELETKSYLLKRTILSLKVVSNDTIEAMRTVFKKISIKNRLNKTNAAMDKIATLGTIVECVEIRLNNAKEYIKKISTVDNSSELIEKVKKSKNFYDKIVKEVQEVIKEEQELKEELGLCPLCGSSFEHSH